MRLCLRLLLRWRRDEHCGRGVRERVPAVAHEERVLEDLIERRAPPRVEREHPADQVLTLGSRSAQPFTCGRTSHAMFAMLTKSREMYT